jgi:hypothetical protein
LGERDKLSSETVEIVAAESPPRTREGLRREKIPEGAPIVKLVESPKAVTMSAEELKRLKVVEEVVRLVEKAGEVLKTARPEPVSSVREEAREEEAAEVVMLALLSRKRAVEGVRAESLIVGSESWVVLEPESITMLPVEEPPRVKV